MMTTHHDSALKLRRLKAFRDLLGMLLLVADRAGFALVSSSRRAEQEEEPVVAQTEVSADVSISVKPFSSRSGRDLSPKDGPNHTQV